jgi:hypothetical protein
MPKRQIKLYFLFTMLSGILCCVFTTHGLVKNLGSGVNPTGRSPIKTLSIRIDPEQREELFTQMRRFADDHNLGFQLTFYSPLFRDKYLLVMQGASFHIFAAQISDPTKLDFNFMIDDPANPPSQENIDDLLDDLKTYVRGIPDLVIIEDK